MTDRDLAVWIQGAAAMIGDRLPTEFEWAAIKEKVSEVVAERVKQKLLGVNKDEQWNLELLKYIAEQKQRQQGQCFPTYGLPGIVPTVGPTAK